MSKTYQGKPINWEEDEEGCWICVSHGHAYPGIRMNYKYFQIDRLIWELVHGKKIPKGMVIMHTCDKPKCINPEHLALGTPGDNSRDMVAKKRNGGPWGHAKEGVA